MLAASESHANNSKPLTDITVQNLDARPTSIDSNEDGKADIWQEFSLTGKLMAAQYDIDFDGKIDEWLTYNKDFKERIVMKKHEQHNKLIKRKTIEHFSQNGNIKSIEIFDELSNEQWQLVERQTYIEKNKHYKVEEFINGKAQKEYLRPAELLK
jgi:hypothetical protein